MAIEKRSPPVMPPPVLTITASRASPALGKRTRSEPCSCTRARRVTPPSAATVSATRPVARLAAKISLARSATATGTLFASPGEILRRGRSNRQRALERAFVQIALAAGIDDGAAVHDHQIVAQLLGEVEILLDQNDRHLLQAAQIG